jgi:hypothetical protein
VTLGSSAGLHAGWAVIDASSARPPAADPQGVGVLDPSWWTSTSQEGDPAALSAASTQAIDSGLADLADDSGHRGWADPLAPVRLALSGR